MTTSFVYFFQQLLVLVKPNPLCLKEMFKPKLVRHLECHGCAITETF